LRIVPRQFALTQSSPSPTTVGASPN
jgi:hypothetical protein